MEKLPALDAWRAAKPSLDFQANKQQHIGVAPPRTAVLGW